MIIQSTVISSIRWDSETMANSSGKRIKTFFGFIHQSLPLVDLCGMQIRSATSDPELERHFFPQKGKKGTKARAKITSIWRLQKLAHAFESVLHTAVKSGDVAGGGVSIRGQHREQTQLTDTQLRAGGSGKTLLEGCTATAKVTPSCRSDEVRICDEGVYSWRRVIAPAFGCQRAGGRKASLMRAVWAGLPAGPQDGMGAEGASFSSLLRILSIPEVCVTHCTAVFVVILISPHRAVLLHTTTTPSSSMKNQPFPAEMYTNRLLLVVKLIINGK